MSPYQSLLGPSGLSIVSSPALNSQPFPGSSGFSVNILSALGLSSSIMSALTSFGVVASGSSDLSHSGSSDALTSDQHLVQQHGDVSEKGRWEHQLNHAELTLARLVGGQ